MPGNPPGLRSSHEIPFGVRALVGAGDRGRFRFGPAVTCHFEDDWKCRFCTSRSEHFGATFVFVTGHSFSDRCVTAVTA